MSGRLCCRAKCRSVDPTFAVKVSIEHRHYCIKYCHFLLLASEMDINKETESLNRILNRLASTPADKIEGVLQVLLPKLIEMTSANELRDVVLQIVAIVLKRVKEWNICLPVDLILATIRNSAEAVSPLPVNVAISLIDASIKNFPKNRAEECMLPLLQALQCFEVFSSQSDSLCSYTIQFLDVFQNPMYKVDFPSNSCLSGRKKFCTADIIGDWFLDIALCQGGLTRSGVGSVQPGLSGRRSHRISAKKESWIAADLRSIKLAMIASFSRAWLPRGYCIAVCVACSVDVTDEVVCTQANYRVTGAKSLFSLTSENMDSVWPTLLSICLPTQSVCVNPIADTKALTEYSGSDGVDMCNDVEVVSDDELVKSERTPFREDFVVAILHFLKKNAIFPSSMTPFAVAQLSHYFLRSFSCTSVGVGVGVVGRTTVSANSDFDPNSVLPSSLRVLASTAALANSYHDTLATNCRNSLQFSVSSGSSSLLSIDAQLQYCSGHPHTQGLQLTMLKPQCVSKLIPSDVFLSASRLLLEQITSLLSTLASLRMTFTASSSLTPTASALLHHLCSIIDRTLLLAPVVVLSSTKLVTVLLLLLSQQSSASATATATATAGATSNSSPDDINSRRIQGPEGTTRSGSINEREGKFISSDNSKVGRGYIHYDVMTTLLATLGGVRQQYYHHYEKGKQ